MSFCYRLAALTTTRFHCRTLSSVASVSIPAPYTGTVRYPRDALLNLGGRILEDLRIHYTKLHKEAVASEDDVEECERSYDLYDTRLTLPSVDYATWFERHYVDMDYARGDPLSQDEVSVQKRVEGAKEEKDGAPSRLAQEAAFLNCGSGPKVGVIVAACSHRRATRGTAPAEDPNWEKEDALLHFIEYLANPHSAGMFAPAEESH